MKFINMVCVCIFSITLLPVLGCNSDATSTKKMSKPFDPTVSRKLAVVSPVYLSKEKEGANKSSHGASIEFAKNGSGVAYIEPFGGKFRVVHNGKAGKLYFAVSELIVSSDGKRVAYVGNIDGVVNLTIVDGKEGYPFGEDDNHWFTADGKQHVSTVTQVGSRFLVINGNIVQKYRIEQGPELSSDSNTIAFSIKNHETNEKQLIVTDLKMQNTKVINSCGDSLFPNTEQTLLAVGCSEGGKKSIKVIDFKTRTVLSDNKYDGTISKMKFSPNTGSLLYVTIKNEKQRVVAYNGKEEMLLPGDEILSDPLVLSDPESVGVIVGDVFKARLYRAFVKQQKTEKGYGYVSDFVSSKDGRNYAFIAVNHNEEQQYLVVNGNEGIKFDKIVSPLFTSDGRFIVYRARIGGKRFLVVSDLNGKIIRQHKEYDMVFQPTISADGTSVSYGVLDGNELWWKVEKL